MRFYIIGFTCALAGVLHATELPDGATLLRQSVQASAAHSFQYESDIKMEMEIHGQTNIMSMTSKVVSRPPNRIHMESKSQMGEMRLISDGEFVWMWLSFLNQYTRKSVSSGALDAFKNFGFGTGGAAEAVLARARTVRPEQIVTSGISHDCWVVDIPFESFPLPVPPGSELKDGNMRVWIDRSNHAVLRIDTSGSMHAAAMSQPMQVRQSMVVRSISIDVPIPDSMFLFEPPPEAKQVAEFGRLLTNGVDLTGKPAPALTTEALNGDHLDLAKLRGKVVLLDFWTTWCLPCRSEMKELDSLYREFKDGGLVVLGLSVGEERDTVIDFLRKNAVSYPVALADISLASSFGATTYPTHVIINRTGVVSVHQTGSVSKEHLLESLKKAGLSDSAVHK